MTQLENQELTNVEFLRSLTQEQIEFLLKNGCWEQSDAIQYSREISEK